MTHLLKSLELVKTADNPVKKCLFSTPREFTSEGSQHGLGCRLEHLFVSRHLSPRGEGLVLGFPPRGIPSTAA
jgi:hypothetical protein